MARALGLRGVVVRGGLASVFLGIAWLGILSCPCAAAAEEICGIIRSGDHPVVGAQVLASAEGILAVSDDGGRFCLADLAGKLQKIRIIALGFHPAELWAHVDAELRIELVPLRTVQVGGGSPGEEGFAPDIRLRQRAVEAKALGRSPDPLFLVLAADSVWVAVTPEGAAAESVALLLDALDSGAPPRDSSEVARYWIDVAGWARDLETRCCGVQADGEPGACGIPAGVCDFLDRAIVVSLVRAHLWGDSGGTDELHNRLAGLLESRDPELHQWAEMLARRLDLPIQDRR